jgi:predicted nucleic acid-binding protein
VIRVVVSDATPLNYLILINAVGVLPRLYSSVLIPPAVAAELSSPKAPAAVLALVRNPPSWLEVRAPGRVDYSLGLDAGETEAIALAAELGIEAILMDERKGRKQARQKGLTPVGTLTILEQAAENGWIDFEENVSRLRETTFRVHPQLIQEAKERLRAK